MLGAWGHRGNVEKYFKHRYSFYNAPIGGLTEYYNFFTPEQAKSVLRDLRRMRAKELSKVEVDILNGKPSWVEQFIVEQEQIRQQQILIEQNKIRRSQAIKTGMSRAKNWGQHVGRPAVSESVEEFLAKPSSQKVIAALNEGLSLRKAAEKADVAINTVRKVKDLYLNMV